MEPDNPALFRDRRGATAIEYALLAAMAAIIAIGGFVLLGDAASGLWTTLGTEVGTAIGGPEAASE